MILPKQISNKSIPWFNIGLLGIFLLSVALRFWGLDRFNAFVFDEVYYAKFANDYLTKTPFFNAHPPLSQYIIAIGIWIGSHLPFGQDSVNNLTGSLLSPWDYRWINAFTGSFIPLVVAALAYQLTRRPSYALIAALFAACDGLFLVESRYALNNIYLVILGLLAQLFFLKALDNQGNKRWLWLVLAGIGFGASACIKWNGLWFLFGTYLLLIFAWGMRLIQGRRIEGEERSFHPAESPLQSPLQSLTQLNFGQVVLSLAIIPVAVYSLLWIPHLLLNPTPNFWDMQKEILSYHERIKSGPDVHPYCSWWYSWIFMIRPVVYFYKAAENKGEIDPVLPSLPEGFTKTIFDVHAMGNPALWWFSTVAIFLLLWMLANRVSVWLETRNVASMELIEQVPVQFPPTAQLWLGFYLVVNWFANLLPWIKVTRCTFLYHYMGSSVFAGLALAWWVDRWLHSPQRRLRGMGITVIFLILLAFVFWIPVYLGLPLSPDGWRIRMWFPSWI
ncbi:phospholipid carrier-dependent glycosyltransferase [Kamptonema sp. UHCC 0994]|uniref:dolichyl-phosphate-mannose--protein mannosyltransferase n=1 Tax=Kamptonema sp. UHCC 0994 TaxID=3031329 RepID=UPI0023B93E2F|nr:phospholipid carrier-dependent glycosyltransferase [Kamptonema sp. UHCC 0994]MDF0554965.1 phospholipid carrier-dependent glycosyltransferase [Kamptonema sp. UHCC 0994]